jgi:hypothetical protein
MSNQPINDGGPAFPCGYYSEPIGSIGPQFTIKGGMTLRDYFAAAALQGNLSSQSIDIGYYDGLDGWNKAAKDAYQAADAMLKARESK